MPKERDLNLHGTASVLEDVHGCSPFFRVHVWARAGRTLLVRACVSQPRGGHAIERRPGRAPLQLSTRILCATSDLLLKHLDATLVIYKKKR